MWRQPRFHHWLTGICFYSPPQRFWDLFCISWLERENLIPRRRGEDFPGRGSQNAARPTKAGLALPFHTPGKRRNAEPSLRANTARAAEFCLLNSEFYLLHSVFPLAIAPSSPNSLGKVSPAKAAQFAPATPRFA